MDPLVSIVVICYNAQRWIANAIESALGQTYENREVIVIDDGSTDGSVEVIRSFVDAIRWETGPNRGGCAARNRGLELARGEMVQFLDADDMLKPQKLAWQVPETIGHSEKIVYCDYDVVEAMDGRLVETYSAECAGIDPIAFVLGNMRLSISAPLHWKGRLADIGGFREELKGSQEFDLHLRLAASGAEFHHLKEPLYVVRRRVDSVSSDFVRAVGEQLDFLPAIATELYQRRELTDERRRAFAQRLAQNGRGCLQRGGREVGLAFLRLARDLDDVAAAQVYASVTRRIVLVLGPVATEYCVTGKRRTVDMCRRVIKKAGLSRPRRSRAKSVSKV